MLKKEKLDMIQHFHEGHEKVRGKKSEVEKTVFRKYVRKVCE